MTRAPASRAAKPVKPRPLVLPDAVLAHLNGICANAGGRLLDGPNSVQIADFDYDGSPDYFVDERRVRCAPPVAVAPGGFFSASLFVSVGAVAEEAVKASVFDAQVERTGSGASLVLSMRGVDCGVAPREQRCRNRMVWKPDQRRFFFGERQLLNAAGQVIAAPEWPALAADLPADFAAGVFNFAKRGPKGTGCVPFYKTPANKAAMVSSYNSGDWNSLVRTVVALNCNSDLAWFFLGAAAENSGKFDAAAAYYTAAIARQQKATQSFANLYATCLDDHDGAGCMGVDVIPMSQQALARLQQARR